MDLYSGSGTKKALAFKGIIIGGRKSTVSGPTTTKVAPEVLSLVRAFATEHELYLHEATSYLLGIGLSQHEGWLLEEGETLKYLPKPLLGRVKHKLNSNEESTAQAVEDVLSLGCPPEDVIVPADMNPNLYEWCKANLSHFR